MATAKNYWVWQREDWGNWNLSNIHVSDQLEKSVRTVSKIQTLSAQLSTKDQNGVKAKLLEEETIHTSGIEGKILDRDSVRSSISRRLGISSDNIKQAKNRSIDGIIETLLDATEGYKSPLTYNRLCRWQSSLFPTGRDEYGYPIETGCYRTSKEDMKVVSLIGDREIIHYIAPPSEAVTVEMDTFIHWFNQTAEKPNYIRAAIATYWFVSIHPFDDGNGRLCRAVADMAIAQAEETGLRLYSFSSTLRESAPLMKEYYNLLEACQRGEKTLNNWVNFFLEAVEQAAHNASVLLFDINKKTIFWDKCRIKETVLNERQIKFLNIVLDQGSSFVGNIQRKRYHKINKHVSEETIKRDLQDLLKKDVIISIKTVGRNAGYQLNPEWFET
jgi:Fic family protein